MQTWDILLGNATASDLLRLGEVMKIGGADRTAITVLQELIRAQPRPPLRDVLDHLSDDTLRLACARAGLPLASTGREARQILLASGDANDSAEWLSVEAPRRKPRLAWQGMHVRPAVTSVPTQVLEVVSPHLAEVRDSRQGELDGFLVDRVRREARTPVNRLIWTNDNLVALRTLLDERDPITRDYRYRGKVDLVYIDPPFMVNNDFVADNRIDIPIDGDVTGQKEPSLVEILAYRDTWREGLDSFLSMMRARLELLRDLLAPTGSIYVHLDWHAAHYVKVLMDEVFGYECFQNQITWKRQSAHSDHSQGAVHYGRVSDYLLYYTATPGAGWMKPQFLPYDPAYVKRDYRRVDSDGRRYRLSDMSGPGGSGKGNPRYEVMGVTRYWRYSEEKMRELIRANRVEQTSPGAVPQYKRFLDEMDGVSVQEIWDDIQLNNRSGENTGYPTQKPIQLLERIISASCPPGGLVLDCFLGSGTTAEAAERLGRRWVGIDNSKYGIHLTRKRLIALHNQDRPPETPQYDYVECESCKNIERKTKRQKSPGPYKVRPFSVESMGVYQRDEVWLDAIGKNTGWRTAMVEVFGGEPVTGFQYLHGFRRGTWVHVGPLDAPVPMQRAWAIAREAADTQRKQVTILTADLDVMPSPERRAIEEQTGVSITMRVIPATAIDLVAKRLQGGRHADGAREAMAIPAFYAPLDIELKAQVEGPEVTLTLARCEVDAASFKESQRPAKAIEPHDGMTPAQQRRARKAMEKWEARRADLDAWLAETSTWQHFVDFWAIDWDYGDHRGADGRHVFDTDWQSFRKRRARGDDGLELSATVRYTAAGTYVIAARVTDVFGNDGIKTVTVEVGR